MMTDEAVLALENFLDTAMMGKLETVTIIHGKGTGGGAERRAHLPQAQPICEVLPPRPLRRR